MPINMAEKILVSASAGVINSVLAKLANLIGKEFVKLKDVRKQAEFLHEELSSMAALLEDLADMEGLDNRTMEWRNKVREMSYDIEDCLDDFTHRVGGSCDGKGLLHRLMTLRARHQLANQIKELKAHVQEASERRMRYKLDDCMSKSGNKLDDCMSGSGNVAVDPRITALYAETSRLVGIDGPKEEVINLLTKQVDDVSAQELRVVSIVGFGGLGKTTLAREVYKKLGESFGCKAFVSVSQRPDMMMLLKRLVTQILKEGVDTHELQGLIDNLRNYLQDKRYLVVIDDLWDPSAWEIIKCALPEGHFGSRVLTTTRIETVAVTSCNFQWEFVYRMKPLDDHNSRQLFYRRVFGLDNSCPQPFEEPSKKILRKCGGMPLAIISIASLLASQSNRSVGQWNYVLDSVRSDLSSNPTLEGMRQILSLSYTHLPHHLKTCLLYIGMYPEDHDIQKDHLVMQWVAEGFVNGLDGRDAVEIAESYFNDLVNRSMIIQIVAHDNWSPERFYHKVHDMVLDLIVSKSAEENFLGVAENLQTVTKIQQCKARRFSLQLHGSGLDKRVAGMSLPHVRSLFFFGLPLRSLQQLDLKFLRVLFVCHAGSVDLTSIGKLFQLRYLYVSFEQSFQLPRQICRLQHLETLIIEDRHDDEHGFGLYDVIHLPYLPALSCLRVPLGIVYPDGISKMKSLRTLGSFFACKQSVDNLRALGELLNLRELTVYSHGSFSIEGIDNQAHNHALLSSMEKLINCNLRRLKYSAMDESCYVGWNSLRLSGCNNLEQLHLLFMFPRLPAWIGQLNALSILEIEVEDLCQDGISVLAGLPSLTHLLLQAHHHVPEEGIIFFGGTAFPALCCFEFFTRKDIALHIEAGAMPKVEKLRLSMSVDQLKACGVRFAGIEHLASLKKVVIHLNYSRPINEEPDVPIIKDAIMSFFDEHHPGRPIIQIIDGLPIRPSSSALCIHYLMHVFPVPVEPTGVKCPVCFSCCPI